jgi:hypothetical protein
MRDLHQTSLPDENTRARVLRSGKSQKTLTDENVRIRRVLTGQSTDGRKVKKAGIQDVHNLVVYEHSKRIGMGSFKGHENEVAMLDKHGYELDTRLGAIG